MKWTFVMVLILFGIAGCNKNNVCTDFRGENRGAQAMAPQYVKGERTAKCVMACGAAGIGFGAGYRGSSSQVDACLQGSGGCKSADIPRQMLIKTATVRFEVKNYDESRKKIAGITKTCNAYVASEREYKNDYQISNTLSIRVPDSAFVTLIDSIVSQAKNLDEKSIHVEDVTEEYIDTDSRLKTRREIEKRYLEILKQARNVKDMLEVEQELGNVREQIESAEGRLTYLSHQVSFSSVDLTFYEQKNIIPKQRVSWLARCLTAFSGGWNGLLEFTIGLISNWPFLCVIAIIAITILKLIQKKRWMRAMKTKEKI